MENKNINSGNINTEGGNSNIGDTYIKNIFEGLPLVLVEFKERLKEIEELTNLFKVKTALGLLENLENRVKEIEYVDNNKILSKIFYLKGICKKELPEFNMKNIALDFVNAYKLNGSDTAIRDRACVEYLNIDQKHKAVALADKILKTDEFSHAAWFVKAVTDEDLKVFLVGIPKIVHDEYNFQLALVNHIVQSNPSILFEDLQQFGVPLNIDFTKYKEVTFTTLEAWRLVADLAINKVFNDYPQRYISGVAFSFQNSQLVTDVINLLSNYAGKLRDTEIKESIVHQLFFLSYFSYLLTNDKQYLYSLSSDYEKIDKTHWFYTFCLSQVLNHNIQFDVALQHVHDYESAGNELISEFYLFKASLYNLNNRSSEVPEIFGKYLDVIGIIEEKNGMNIINSFLHILFKKADTDVINSLLEKVREKDFKNIQLKTLLEITISTRYLKNIDNETIYQELVKLQEFKGFDNQWKSLIAENLNTVDKRKEAIKCMHTFLDRNVISEHLRFYINLLYEQLCDKNNQEADQYQELMQLLKFWRLNAKDPDRLLLQREHNLYAEINDMKELEDIDAYLYESFPESEDYILNYLGILERNHNLKRIKEVADNITGEIENENFGVSLAMLLLRTEADLDKGFKILYKLASNPINTFARSNYFASQVFLKHERFFASFEEIKIGTWVTYFIGDKKMHQKIEKDSGFQKELIGRKQGEKFTTSAGINGRFHTIYIHEILNDAWQLFREIQEEAANPVNDLGFESLQFPSEPGKLLDFLKSELGEAGAKNHEIREKALDNYYNYRTGLTEVSAAAFGDNYIDAYMYLTANRGSKFTTVPSLFTRPININDDEITYALDFSTLMLFFYLEKELDFKFKHKFSLSFYLKDKIDKEIYELENSPASPMTLQITPNYVRRFETPENFNQKRIEFLVSILEWIDKNCIIDLVSEKLNILPKLSYTERLTGVMKVLTDYICFTQRENCRVISSDTTLFMYTRNDRYLGKIINPEKYLTEFYPEKCSTEFYRFLLKSNYVGINITLDTLKNEFFQYISGGQNCYNLCLENLTYTTHVNPQIIVIISKFLKELYIMQSLTIEQKNLYAGAILSRALYGMPKEVVTEFSKQMWEDFKLMGGLYNQVISILKSILE